MKFLYLISLVIFSISSLELYADGTSGCGLGSKIWKGESGISAHTSAGTTNHTYGNNTFGMTSGTSNCKTESQVKAEELKQIKYIEANLDSVAENMSQGKGEYLAAYGTLLGCKQNSLNEFSKLTQKNYQNIFMEQNSPNLILSNTKLTLLADPILSHNCSKL